MLTRWTRGYRKYGHDLALCSLVLYDSQQLIPSSKDFNPPRIEEIINAQENSKKDKRYLLRDNSTGLVMQKGKIWVPDDCPQTKLKILVSAHCGIAGHRGREATMSIVSENYWWDELETDVNEFVNHCLHCLVSRTGKSIPRPLGHALHGSRPNEVIHADFLFMGAGINDKKYTLMLKDDLSGFIWLWPAESASSEVASEALLQWITSYGSIEWLVTDQGSHFKNQLLRQLTDELQTSHHFTTPYSPWANGTVERVYREVKRATTALLSEWKLAPMDWPNVLECVQSVLNHAPLRRLGRRTEGDPTIFRTPLEVFTGHKPIRALTRALPIHMYEHTKSLDEVRAQQIIGITQFQSALNDMHRKLSSDISKSRERAIKAHNRRTNVPDVSFDVGDYVLVRRTKPGGHKLQFAWQGPRRVVSVKSPWVYEVCDLIHGKKETVHAKRLIIYRGDMDGKELDESLLQAAAHLEANYQTVEKMRGIRRRNGSIEIEVEWEGLPDASDFTWEPLDQLHQDVPDLLEEYLKAEGHNRLKKSALDITSLLK